MPNCPQGYSNCRPRSRKHCPLGDPNCDNSFPATQWKGELENLSNELQEVAESSMLDRDLANVASQVKSMIDTSFLSSEES